MEDTSLKEATKQKRTFPFFSVSQANIFEMKTKSANNHIYFAQHLPRLTDVEVVDENYDEVENN